MASVAERLGVRAPTLYHHVRNKADLLTLLARDAFVTFAADRDAYDQVSSIEEWIDLAPFGDPAPPRLLRNSPWAGGFGPSDSHSRPRPGRPLPGRLTRSQIEALTRLGIPAHEAREVFEACARWTMAAVASQDAAPGGHGLSDNRLFRRGLDWLLSGLHADLESAVSEQSDRRGDGDP
jgi:AcrR family transcriptional regulator